ncbi:MAG TPA: AbrB/MazE/SpoVT family DNA-binding domain-containing protein [Verrucomicrobiae bacterium]
MTTNLGQRGQLVIPKAIRDERKLEPGDDFEVIADEDDADLILLRRIRPAANAGLVDHLTACPYRGALPVPGRRRESMRRLRV